MTAGPSLGRFMARRLAQALFIVVCTAIINFTIVHLAPGDIVDVLAGEAGAADPGYVTSLRASFGLDKPLYVQLGHYLWNIARLHMCYSFRYNMPVISLVLQRLLPTPLLLA